MSIYSNFGFDETRGESAADSPKYKLLNTLKQLGIEQFRIEDANDIFAKVQGALGESGLYSFDPKNANIDLSGDRGGYVGIRPVDRSNPTGPQTFQWMAYNEAVKPQGGWKPGDYGQGSPYGDWTGQSGTPPPEDRPSVTTDDKHLPKYGGPTPSPDPASTTPPPGNARPPISAPSSSFNSPRISEPEGSGVDLAEALRKLSRLFSNPDTNIGDVPSLMPPKTQIRPY